MGQQGETPHFSAVRVREADSLREKLVRALGDQYDFDQLIEDTAGKDVAILELTLIISFFIFKNDITFDNLIVDEDDEETKAMAEEYDPDQLVMLVLLAEMVAEDQIDKLAEMLQLLATQLLGE